LLGADVWPGRADTEARASVRTPGTTSWTTDRDDLM
jgi:hypothetical protein